MPTTWRTTAATSPSVQAAFDEFLHRLPFYGLAVLCIDDPEVAALAAEDAAPRDDLRLRASTPTCAPRTCARTARACASRCACRTRSRTPVTLALPGRHNVQNALAAAAVGWQLGVQRRGDRARAGEVRRHRPPLQPARRSSTTAKGATVQLVDDYGHHPKELEAVFAAARGGWPDKRLVVAFQPHRYSRTRDLFDEFAAVLSSVDALVLTEVYPAGEAPIAGADAKSLARAIRARGRIDPVVVGGAGELADVLPDVLQRRRPAADDGRRRHRPCRAADRGATVSNGSSGSEVSVAVAAAARHRSGRVRPRRRADGRHQCRARGVARFRPQRARGAARARRRRASRSTASRR